MTCNKTVISTIRSTTSPDQTRQAGTVSQDIYKRNPLIIRLFARPQHIEEILSFAPTTTFDRICNVLYIQIN